MSNATNVPNDSALFQSFRMQTAPYFQENFRPFYHFNLEAPIGLGPTSLQLFRRMGLLNNLRRDFTTQFVFALSG
jgi:hypothetical protein